MDKKGCIHIYCGDGKGKTTAATGLAVRAAGNGWPVLFYQFMKDNSSGERKILEAALQITLLKGKQMEKFSFQMTAAEKEEHRNYYQSRFKEIQEMVKDGPYRMLVLDEVIYTIQAGLFDEQLLIGFLQQKPAELEVVLTGNPPGEKLLAAADYVSEICKRKHPFDQGLAARDGIER